MYILLYLSIGISVRVCRMCNFVIADIRSHVQWWSYTGGRTLYVVHCKTNVFIPLPSTLNKSNGFTTHNHINNILLWLLYP